MRILVKSTLLLAIFLLLQSVSLGQTSADSKSKLYVPEIKLTSPVGGESFVIGKQYNITWTSTLVTSIKIEYSTDNGANWWPIVASTVASAKAYPWIVPNLPTDSCKIKLSDVDAQATAVESAIFKLVRPTLSLTSPVGAENWLINSAHNITWTTSGVDTVKIEYSLDNGTTWSTIADVVSAALGTYAWTLPATTSSAALVNISDIKGYAIPVKSAVFTISKPAATVALTAPAGGEKYTVGQSVDLKWNSANIATVKLEFSSDSLATWGTIAYAPAATGTFAVTVPNKPSTKCFVKVSDSTDAAVASVNATAFTIEEAKLTIAQIRALPATSTAGTKVTVRGIVNSPNFHATKNSFYMQDGTAGINIYGGATYGPTPGDSVVVVGWLMLYNGTLEVSDSSTSLISVTKIASGTAPAPKVVTVAELNANGENYESQLITVNTVSKVSGTWPAATGGTTTIKCIANGVTTDTLLLVVKKPSEVLSSGVEPVWPKHVTGIATQYTTTGTGGYQIMPRYVADFVTPIVPTVALTAPVAGDILKAGEVKNITWTSAFVTTVKVELSTDSAATWSTIIANTPASAGTYAWTVPNTPSTKCFIKISDSTNAALNSVAGAFTIEEAKLTIAQIRALPATSTAGTKVTVRGIVNSPNFHATKNSFYMQDGTAGINIYGGATYGPTPGDSVVVVGWLMLYNGTLEVSDSSTSLISVTKIASGKAPTPKVITVAELNANGENYESQLITINTVTKVSGTWPAATGGTTTIKCTANGVTTDTLLLVVKKPSEVLSSGVEPVWPKHVTGIATQYTTTGTGGYQIQPRYTSDFEIVVSVENEKSPAQMLKGFALAQNYPNPFNPATTIMYSLDKPGMVTLKIYSILGSEVASLVNEYKAEGNYSVSFNASNLTSGVYIYKLQAGNQSVTKKLTLMK
jgi:hypothetical protein